jgi:16S rRNA (cytosine967-C5)-methyltransferase
MTPSARIQATIELIAEIEAGTRPADAAVGAYFRKRRYVGSKDRAEVAGRVYAMLRHRARLGWWLARIGAPDTARTRTVAMLMLGEGMAVKDAGRAFSGDAYAPSPLDRGEDAVVKFLSGQKLDHPEMTDGIRNEVPGWAVEPLKRAFGDRFEAEVAALSEVAPLDLRVNEWRGTREEAQKLLAASRIAAEPTPLSPLGLRVRGRPQLARHPAFASGLVEIQDEGSQIVAFLADARPGQQVVDFCAGAGGKTLAMAARMAGRGRVVACDVVDKRLDRARDRIRRAGLDNVEPRLLESERDRWIKRQKGKFDRVLIDAPCSGTGSWRRNPDSRWRESDLADLSALQGRILDSASRLAKPGGRVIYATCSVLCEENEDVVAAFLAAHPEFAVLPVGQVWPAAVGGPSPVETDFLRLSPARHGTDGFFVAILERAAAPVAAIAAAEPSP